MELVPNGTLLSQREQLAGQSYMQLLQLSLQIANGIEYLHGLEPAVAHLDLKP